MDTLRNVCIDVNIRTIHYVLGQNDHLQVYVSKLDITYNVEMLFVTTIKLLKLCKINQLMDTS
jgi:hypothetical protein